MLDPRSFRYLRKSGVAKIAATWLVIVVLACIIIPAILPHGYDTPSHNQYASPTLHHPFGTNLNGTDMLYRVFSGGRVSLIVGLSGALVSLFIGVGYGMIAGYVGGKTDAMMMRFVDILYSVPRLIFVLIAINAFNTQLEEFANHINQQWMTTSSRIIILVFSLGLIEWLTMARIVRGQVLALKSRAFVTAASALGQSNFKILLRHILPNLVGIITIYLTLTIPAIIIDESFLSFLGLGVQAPQTSWGALLADGAGALNPLRSYWWLLVFPAFFMATTLLALNLLGDTLRDAFDPRSKR
ncbi:MAG: ABC transporter permease [Chthoniobacterales bacterium]